MHDIFSLVIFVLYKFIPGNLLNFVLVFNKQFVSFNTLIYHKGVRVDALVGEIEHVLYIYIYIYGILSFYDRFVNYSVITDA